GQRGGRQRVFGLAAGREQRDRLLEDLGGVAGAGVRGGVQLRGGGQDGGVGEGAAVGGEREAQAASAGAAGRKVEALSGVGEGEADAGGAGVGGAQGEGVEAVAGVGEVVGVVERDRGRAGGEGARAGGRVEREAVDLAGTGVVGASLGLGAEAG